MDPTDLAGPAQERAGRPAPAHHAGRHHRLLVVDERTDVTAGRHGFGFQVVQAWRRPPARTAGWTAREGQA